MIDVRVSLDHEVWRKGFILLGLRITGRKSERNRYEGNKQIPQINWHDLLRLERRLNVSRPRRASFQNQDIVRTEGVCANVTDHRLAP